MIWLQLLNECIEMKLNISNLNNTKFAEQEGWKRLVRTPYYGWDSSFFDKNPSYIPVGTWSAFESKGIGDSGGNKQVTDRKKVFVKFPSVVAAMEYKAFYIEKHHGNWARWHNARDVEKQEAYRNSISKISPKISNLLKVEK